MSGVMDRLKLSSRVNDISFLAYFRRAAEKTAGETNGAKIADTKLRVEEVGVRMSDFSYQLVSVLKSRIDGDLFDRRDVEWIVDQAAVLSRVLNKIQDELSGQSTFSGEAFAKSMLAVRNNIREVLHVYREFETERQEFLMSREHGPHEGAVDVPRSRPE